MIIYSKYICAHIANIYIICILCKETKNKETTIDVFEEGQLYFIYTYAILNQ